MANDAPDADADPGVLPDHGPPDRADPAWNYRHASSFAGFFVGQ